MEDANLIKPKIIQLFVLYKETKILTTIIVADDPAIFLEGLILLFDSLDWINLLASATNGDLCW